MKQLTCQNCQNEFTLTDVDLEFLSFFDKPIFKHCYYCRRKHKLAFVNYTTFFLRPNNKPNSNENIISTIDKNAPFPVFDFHYYYSDAHEPANYFIEYDDSRNFFENFYELFKICPQPALMQNLSNVESPYSSYGSQMKNAYYCFGGMFTENTAYSMWALKTRDSQDVLISLDSEKIYDCVFPEKCFNSTNIYFSKNILDCYFMYDCRNCTNCFGCINLRNKSYCIENIQYSKEEYAKRIFQYDLSNKQKYSQYKKDFFERVKALPVRGSGNEHTVHSSGIYLLHTKNVTNSVWSINSEQSRYIEFTLNLKNCLDVVIGANSSNLCNTVVCGEQSFDIKNSLFCRSSNNIEYCMNLRDCKNCFGCIGLRGKEYYIFNKPHTKEQYDKRVLELKEKMTQDNIYGDFFPLYLSPYAYNSTLAGFFDDLDEKKLKNDGARFSVVESNIDSNEKTFSILDLPDSVKDPTFFNYIEKPLIGLGIHRPFRIREIDLNFYKTLNVYPPIYHPSDRFKERLKLVNNFKIKQTNCRKCDSSFLTMHDESYTIFCDTCFSNIVV